MEQKKSKYDTNPLDPDFVKKTEDMGSQDNSGPATQEVKGGATREIGSSANEWPRPSNSSCAADTSRAATS